MILNSGLSNRHYSGFVEAWLCDLRRFSIYNGYWICQIKNVIRYRKFVIADHLACDCVYFHTWTRLRCVRTGQGRLRRSHPQIIDTDK